MQFRLDNTSYILYCTVRAMSIMHTGGRLSFLQIAIIIRFFFSGILTGSVYRDFALLKNGFPGENLANGSVLVVKTHEWGPQARHPFNKAVLLGIRHNLAV
jgi:hypothetical protein